MRIYQKVNMYNCGFHYIEFGCRILFIYKDEEILHALQFVRKCLMRTILQIYEEKNATKN